MARQIELNPVSHLTIGTVGVPGKRTFFLQGSRGTHTVSLTIEKEQANMLASSFESLLSDLAKRYPNLEIASESPIWMDMRLREPVEPAFRVGNMGIGYNESSEQIVLVAYELVEEGEDPGVVSYWATPIQIQALVQHTYEVIRAGRPICGNCLRPIDPEGHFCPNRNGHIH